MKKTGIYFIIQAAQSNGQKILMANEADSLPNEIWKDVPGAPDYEVSSLGRVRRKAFIIKSWDNFGYRYIQIKDKRWAMHRLVCHAFNGAPPKDKPMVAHGDGVRDNNSLENLRWASYSENLYDALDHGTRKPIHELMANRPVGSRPNSKLTAEQIKEIKYRRANGETRRSLAREYGVSEMQITRHTNSGSRRRYGD